MKIEHVALYVQDLEKTKEFFVRFFGATANERYFNSNTGFSSYFLSFSEGARLEIMTRPGMKFSTDRTGRYHHVAFKVEDRQRVDAFTNKLVAAGYKCISGPRQTGDGYYESCIQGPDEILIEITE